MLNSYYIELRTGSDYSTDAYDAAAGRLSQLAVTILSDPTTISSLTKDAPRDSCRSEVEITLEQGPVGRELVAKALVDVTSGGKVAFDKGKLTKLIKANAAADEWPHMKVIKKAVPREV